MSSSKPYLKTHLDETLKDAFTKKAKELGHTEASFLRFIIEKVLQANTQEMELPTATERKDAAIEICITPLMKAELASRAKQQGMKTSAYVRAMMRAHLSQNAYFTEKELIALESLIYQLSALGRNVNQIARALNTSLDQAHKVDVREIERAVTVVKDVRDQVGQLIRANLAEWGIKRSKEKY